MPREIIGNITTPEAKYIVSVYGMDMDHFELWAKLPEAKLVIDYLHEKAKQGQPETLDMGTFEITVVKMEVKDGEYRRA